MEIRFRWFRRYVITKCFEHTKVSFFVVVNAHLFYQN
jgi:hypothetical protein